MPREPKGMVVRTFKAMESGNDSSDMHSLAGKITISNHRAFNVVKQKPIDVEAQLKQKQQAVIDAIELVPEEIPEDISKVKLKVQLDKILHELKKQH